MAVAEDKAGNQLREITECSICMSAFIDPRMLPCIHTFCFQCLQRTAEQKKPGGKVPCPLCRKEFTIPPEGIIGLQRNFFMENLLEFKLTLLQGNHRTLEIGSETKEEEIRRNIEKFCSKHTQKPLDYYCADCKQIVCVSCFVESHKFHDCKDVNTVDEKFRQMIERYSLRISNYADDMLSLKQNAKMRKADFRKKISENETAIIKRSGELKDMIDEHTKSLLDELSAIKSGHVKEMEIEMEEIDLCCTTLSSFEAYCTELRTKGSAIDVCSVVDKLLVRAAELDRDHDEFIARPLQSIEVSFRATCLTEFLLKSNNNFVGQIKASSENKPASKNQQKELSPLPDFIELTTEPDMITLDDDPNTMRAKMPCGHVIGSESMADYFRHTVNNGKFCIICPAQKCNCVWEYFLVRHVACLSDEETQELERKQEQNFLQRQIVNKICPGCKTRCMPAECVGNRVGCPICTAERGKKFYFCWICLNEWKRLRSSGPCGNPDCVGSEKQRTNALANCPKRRINLCFGCPSIRACPRCGLLIEHQDTSGHISCRNCHCKFCFICLKEFKDGKWQCNFLGTACSPAPRQVP